MNTQTDIRKDIYPDDIAEVLQKLSGVYGYSNLEYHETNRKELTDIIYDIMASAQNDLNRDGWRILYRVMQEITSEYQYKEV